MSTTECHNERPAGRLPTLDGWRGIAILLVLLDHGADPLLRAVLGLTPRSFDSVHFAFLKDPVGRGGVHLFFALSGFLITWRLLVDERHCGSVSLRSFYLRRVFRIQPAALLYLGVVALLAGAGALAISWPGWLGALTALANFTMGSQSWYTGHFWSLAVEEQFYLLWPLFFLWVIPRRRLSAALGLVALFGLWLALTLRFQIAHSPYMWVRSDIEGSWILWGCVAALALEQPRLRAVLARVATPLLSLIALPLGILSVVLSGLDWKIVGGLTCLTAAATPLLLLGTLWQPRSLLGRLLELPPLMWLGRISFSLYLWQELFLVWDPERSSALGPLQAPPLNIILALACASLSYYLIERPLIRRGERLIGGFPQVPLPESPARLPPLPLTLRALVARLRQAHVGRLRAH